MDENLRYYTTGDIAKHCGVERLTPNAWSQRGKLPEPAARTMGGISLWTHEQVVKIDQDRRAEIERLRKRAALRAAMDELRR